MSPWGILAVVVFSVLNGFYWNAHGSNAADERWVAKVQKERADFAESALAISTHWQGVVNEEVKNEQAKKRVVEQRLRTALNSLRDRPSRPADVSSDPRASCEGANGAELSRPDGEFLSREAARADSLRAALAACYAILDKVGGTNHGAR